MNLIHTTIDDLHANRDGKTVCKAPDSLFTSQKALKMFLSTHASRTLGGHEGTHWTIKTYPEKSALCPFYVSTVDGEQTLEIK